jgi:peptidoglycan/LPS O-acetylase OafA/YrhL
VRRILPPYYFALAFSALCILTLIGNKTGTGWDRCIPITPLGMVTHVLLIQDTVRGVSEQINHSLWSISVEWRLYFLFPLLVILWGRIGALATTTLAILTSYLVFLLLAASPLRAAADPSDAVGMMPHYLGLFTLGMLACNVAFSDTASMSLVRQKTPWGALTLALLILALLCMRMRWHGARIPVAYSDLVVGLWAGTMLIAASFDGLLNRLLSTRGLVFVGTFAYSIYLVHAPLLQILYQYLFHPLGLSKLPLFLAQLSIGTVLIVGASYVFFLCCERPYITGARSAGLQSGRLPS